MLDVVEKFNKILLVDDDIDLLEQNKILLESRGFNIITAESGKDGIKMFEKEKPNACIIDLIMEEKDSGFILAHKIKKTEYGKSVPVFILTSATYETGFKFSVISKEEKEWIKADDLLNKPVVVDELVKKLEKFL